MSVVKDEVQAEEGGSVTVQCVYSEKHRYYRKYIYTFLTVAVVSDILHLRFSVLQLLTGFVLFQLQLEQKKR